MNGQEHVDHPVYSAMNRPLTIWGVERKLFFLAIGTGAATFNFFGSFLGGAAMFVALFTLARVAAGQDPEFLRILLNSSSQRQRYDAAKWQPQDERSPS